MPRSDHSNRALAMTSSSCRRPMVEKTGAESLELRAGRALCATTQMEQEALSVWVGWLWVDSAATVHSIRDRHSQADQRTQKRIGIPALGLECFQLITVIPAKAIMCRLL